LETVPPLRLTDEPCEHLVGDLSERPALAGEHERETAELTDFAVAGGVQKAFTGSFQHADPTGPERIIQAPLP
jgi:hypothetical protein